MRTIDLNDIGGKLLNLVLEENPVSEDIGIIDENGELIAVIIPKYLYDFLQEKVEETEDILDREAVEEFHKEQNEK
jgi:PHD/YefM family antitoxin component YafN of YafNO toxin-antitoxin module